MSTMPRNPPNKSPSSDSIATPIPWAERPIITFAGEGCVMGHWQGVMSSVWSTRATLELVAELEKLLVAASERHPKISSVHLITSSFSLPPADVRAKLGTLTQRYGDRLACSATMLGGTGFWASAIRGAVTGIQVLDLHRRRQRVFANLEELAKWVAPTHNAATGSTITPQELRDALSWMLQRPSVRGERAQA
jgi:hypothetical protein